MESQSSSSSKQRRKLTKPPPKYQPNSPHSQHQHHYSHSIASGFATTTTIIASDGRSLGSSNRSSSSLRRTPSAPPQRSTPTKSSAAFTSSQSNGARSSGSQRSNNPSPVLANGEFLPSTFSPSHKPAAYDWQVSANNNININNHRLQPQQQDSSGGSSNSGLGYFPASSSAAATAAAHILKPSKISNHHSTNYLGFLDGRSHKSSRPPNYHRLSDPHLQPLSSKTSEELVGAPFDGTSILNHLESTKTSPKQSFGSNSSNRRPPPPPLIHAQTSPDPRHASPQLRHSTSFSRESPMAMSLSEKAQQGARMGESQLTGPKRYSDETKEPKPGVLRKKSGFSGLMSTLVGSPKKPIISAPENPVHVTHVGYDSSTGQFTVRVSPVAAIPVWHPARLSEHILVLSHTVMSTRLAETARTPRFHISSSEPSFHLSPKMRNLSCGVSFPFCALPTKTLQEESIYSSNCRASRKNGNASSTKVASPRMPKERIRR